MTHRLPTWIGARTPLPEISPVNPTRAQQGPGDGAAVASDLMTGDLP